MRRAVAAVLTAWAAGARGRTANAGAPDPNVSSAVIATWGNDYDKTRAPNNVTVVKVSATINKVTGLSERLQEYGLNFYFRQMWKDERLRWDPAEFGNITELTHVPSTALWTPDTFFVSANRAERFEEFTIVKSDGSVAWSSRYLVTFFCGMDFQWYPFDVQNCTNHLESYGYSPDVLALQGPDSDTRPWNVPLDVANTAVQRVGVYMLTGLTFSGGTTRYQTLHFSRVTWEFIFARSWSRYFLTTFVPLWLVVGLSCVGSWISPDAAPARVAMGITTVLVLITLMYTLTRNLPETDKTTAMDVYFVLCITVVAVNMAEYALINSLLKALTRRERSLEGRRKHLSNLLALVRLRDLAEESAQQQEDRIGGEDTELGQSQGLNGNPALPPALQPRQPPELHVPPPHPPPRPPPREQPLSVPDVQLSTGEATPKQTPRTGPQGGGLRVPAQLCRNPSAFSELASPYPRMTSAMMYTPQQEDAGTLLTPRTQHTTRYLELKEAVALEEIHQRTLDAVMTTDNQRVDMDALLETQRAELKEVFRMFDQDGSGEIDCSELKVVMETIGASQQEVTKMMALFDKDKSGTLDFQEFGALMIRASELLRNLQFHRTEVRAIAFCGAGVTHSSIDSVEHVFRCTVPIVFTLLSISWFVVIAVNSPNHGGDVKLSS